MFKKQLQNLNACENAIEWVGCATLEGAWAECPRGDWMIWLAMRMAGQPGWPSPVDVVVVLCDIVEPIVSYIPANSKCLLTALETVRQWCIDDVSRMDVLAAYTDVAAIHTYPYTAAIRVTSAVSNVIFTAISIFADGVAAVAYGGTDAAAVAAAVSAADAVGEAVAAAGDAVAAYDAVAAAAAADAANADAADVIRQRLTIGGIDV